MWLVLIILNRGSIIGRRESTLSGLCEVLLQGPDPLGLGGKICLFLLQFIFEELDLRLLLLNLRLLGP